MGTSCTQLCTYTCSTYVANKSRESETSAYYNLHMHLFFIIFFDLHKKNTISSNILQYIAICNMSIFSIGHIVLYCSSKYCNISIYCFTPSTTYNMQYVPSELHVYFSSELHDPLYNAHNNTAIPHVYTPSTMMETFVILWYLSSPGEDIETCEHAQSILCNVRICVCVSS